jgi:hypothetical protein
MVKCHLIESGMVLVLVSTASPTSTARANAPAEKEKLGVVEKKAPQPLPCHVTPDMNFMDAPAGDHPRENLLSAAWFARMVQQPESIRTAAWKSLREAPLKVVDLYAGPFGLDATVLEFENNALVLYRGTQNPLDYVLNAGFFTTPGFIHELPGWVHKGFLINFGLTWRKLRRTLMELAEKGKPVSFAAHSLGGVLSQYAAWRAVDDGISVGRVYAFQSPNAGDAKFKESFEKRFAGRMTNVLFGEDLTPHIPPIRETAKEVSRASLKPLSGLLWAVVRQANYGALGGRFELARDGSLHRTEDEDIPSKEKEFWSSYRTKTGGQGFPKGLGPQSPLVNDHNVDKVVCALALRD